MMFDPLARALARPNQYWSVSYCNQTILPQYADRKPQIIKSVTRGKKEKKKKNSANIRDSTDLFCFFHIYRRCERLGRRNHCVIVVIINIMIMTIIVVIINMMMMILMIMVINTSIA